MHLETDLHKGSVKALILSLLQEQPMYGYQLSKELQRRSKGYFEFKEGTLYPALHRMEQEGLLRGEWQVVDGGTLTQGLPSDRTRGTRNSLARRVSGRHSLTACWLCWAGRGVETHQARRGAQARRGTLEGGVED